MMTEPQAAQPMGTPARVAVLGHRIMPVTDGNALDVWRHHKRISANTNAICPEICNGAPPHHPELVRRLQNLLAQCDPADCAIIYVHRGHQPRYRSPVFQSLLAQLPAVGGQFSHRSSARTLPDEVFSLIHSSLTQFRDVFLVWDKMDRLLAETAAEAASDGAQLALIYGLRSDGKGGFVPQSHHTFYAAHPASASSFPSNREVADHVVRSY